MIAHYLARPRGLETDKGMPYIAHLPGLTARPKRNSMNHLTRDSAQEDLWLKI